MTVTRAVQEGRRGVISRGQVPHGFRSSFRDWAAEETDHPREVVEAALAHVVQNKVEAGPVALAVLEDGGQEAGELVRDCSMGVGPGRARRGVSAAPPGWLQPLLMWLSSQHTPCMTRRLTRGGYAPPFDPP